MTDRREDDGFAVTPVRVGGGASRATRGRRRLGIVVVVMASLTIVGAAVVGPRLNDRPNLDVAYFATPTPRPTPPPTPVATPTPLPTITLGESGPLRGRLPILSESLRTLDLATGVQGPGMGISLGNDAVFPAPTGAGWICVCTFDNYGDTEVVRDIELIRLDPDGVEQDRSPLVTLTGSLDPDGPSAVQTDVAVAPDGRTALLVAGRRTPQAWDYSAARIDVVAGSIGRLTVLGNKRLPKPPSQPSPSPGATPLPVRTDLFGPVVRRSPDGRSAVAWVSLQQHTESELRAETFGWRITLDADGLIAAADYARGLSAMPEYCTTGAFLADDRFVSICPDPAPNEGGPQPWVWLELDSTGRLVSRVSVPGARQWYADPLLDRANGVAWLWDPMDLTLVRVGDHGRQIESRQFPDAEPTPGDRSIGAVMPEWARPWSSVVGQYQTAIAGAPDGSRLYLLGFAEAPSNDTGQAASLGVLVVDPATFALVDRWAPQANYVSVQVVLDGTAVAAAGAPHVDVTGKEVPWEASLTLHDATNGRVRAQYGALGEDWYGSFVP
jgi:hypothetical protein